MSSAVEATESFGSKILLSAILHAPAVVSSAPTVEALCCECPVLFLQSSAKELQACESAKTLPLHKQLANMQSVFAQIERPSFIDDVHMLPIASTTETLCYYENIVVAGASEIRDETALLALDYVFINEGGTAVPGSADGHISAPTQWNFSKSTEDDVKMDAMYAAPLLVFDDRYEADGFWPFFEALIQRGSKNCTDFKAKVIQEDDDDDSGIPLDQQSTAQVIVQLQGIAVPQVHRPGEAGASFDIFYTHQKDVEEPRKEDASSQPPDRIHKTTTKLVVRNGATLHNVLSGAQALCEAVEEQWGVPHCVFYLSFFHEHSMRKQNLCVIRLTHSCSIKLGVDDLLSSEVLRMLVEELTLASAEGPLESSPNEEVLDVFDEEEISRAFEQTRLTRIVRKVMTHNYATCRDTSTPLFHWVVNLPECELLEVVTGTDLLPEIEQAVHLLCAHFSPANTSSETAASILVSLQEINLLRQQRHEKLQRRRKEPSHGNEEEITPSAVHVSSVQEVFLSDPRDSSDLLFDCHSAVQTESPAAGTLEECPPSNLSEAPQRLGDSSFQRTAPQCPLSVHTQQRHTMNVKRGDDHVHPQHSSSPDTSAADLTSAEQSPDSCVLLSARGDSPMHSCLDSIPVKPLVVMPPVRISDCASPKCSVGTAVLVRSESEDRRQRRRRPISGCSGRRGPTFDRIPDHGDGELRVRRRRPLTSGVKAALFACPYDDLCSAALLYSGDESCNGFQY